MKNFRFLFLLWLISSLWGQTHSEAWLTQLKQSFEQCQTLDQLTQMCQQFEARHQNNPQKLIAFYQFYQQYVYLIAQKNFKMLQTEEDKKAFIQKGELAHQRAEQYLLKADSLCQKLQGDSVNADIKTYCRRLNARANYLRFKQNMKIKPLPDITFTDLQGRVHKLSDFRGRYVLLHFWNMHSQPCVSELKYLKKAFKKFKRQNFTMISFHISVGQLDSTWENQALINFINETNLNWLQVIGSQTQAIQKKYFVRNFPTLYLLNPKGIVCKTEKDLREERLLNTLNEIFQTGEKGYD